MRTSFNEEMYNTKRLQPRNEHIEFNKCTHAVINENNKCVLCGTELKLALKSSELLHSADVIIDYLESMKMLSNGMSKKECKAAQKYFDMIPLLKNINNLYDICNEKSNQLNEIYEELYKSDEFDMENGCNE